MLPPATGVASGLTVGLPVGLPVAFAVGVVPGVVVPFGVAVGAGVEVGGHRPGMGTPGMQIGGSCALAGAAHPPHPAITIAGNAIARRIRCVVHSDGEMALFIDMRLQRNIA